MSVVPVITRQNIPEIGMRVARVGEGLTFNRSIQRRQQGRVGKPTVESPVLRIRKSAGGARYVPEWKSTVLGKKKSPN